MEAPIYLKGRARRGPTFGEALLVHAVARLALHPWITNVQASWVKLGPDGARQALAAGVNDLGGTLMNESISRAAGSEWGQELPPEQMEALIRSAGRVPRQRTTTYGVPGLRAGAGVVRRRASGRANQPAGARRGPEGAAAARAARCAGDGRGSLGPSRAIRWRRAARWRTRRRARIVCLYMTRIVVVLAVVVLVSVELALSSGRIVSAGGVRVVVPVGWQQIEASGDGNVVDPRTLLVVGTKGVRPRPSLCQIAAYRVQPRGSVVVIVGWKTATSGGGAPTPGRDALERLRSVRRPSFECFAGRGAVAQVLLGGKAYQVSVMVGDLASRRRVAEALAVGRSFALAR